MVTLTPRAVDGSFKSWDTVAGESEAAGFAEGLAAGKGIGFLAGIGVVLGCLVGIGLFFWFIDVVVDLALED
jgi:hypothetical protein